MTPEIKDMKTWAEAERWLAKHGYGLAQIEEQKELWYKIDAKPAAVAPAPKPAPKPVEKPAVAKATTKK